MLIEVLAKQSFWFVFIVLTAFLSYVFRTEIIRVIDLKIIGKDIVVSSINRDIAINKSLTNLMNDTNSDRAYIFRFHNGVTYYDGTHKSKMSCDYEVTRRGISREAQRLQDIPTGLYADWIKSVIANEMYVVDVESMDDELTKQTLEMQGIKGIAVAPYYRNGNLYALIGIDYVRTITNDEVQDFYDNRDEKIQYFLKRTQNIGRLMI